MKTPSKMLIAVIAVFALTAFVAFSSGPSREDFEPVTVTVHTGDTPWTIAERYCPDSMDIRDYLRLCAAENGLDNWDVIRPGETYTFLEIK